MSTKISEKPKFAADVMVGRLARWLRTAGFDTVDLDDKELESSLQRAANEGRWLLTRRQKAKFDGAGIIYLESENWRPQFAKVMDQFSFSQDSLEMNTRCNRCNVVLRTVDSSAVKGLVPPHVHKTHKSFHQCKECQRVYWMGTHIEKIQRELTDVFIYHLFRCNHCGVSVSPNQGKYRGRLTLESVYQPLEITEEDIMEDHEVEIDSLLDRINEMSEEELEEAVAVIHDFTLCSGCHRKFLDQTKSFLNLNKANE